MIVVSILHTLPKKVEEYNTNVHLFQLQNIIHMDKSVLTLVVQLPPNATHSEIRQSYWIMKGQGLERSVLSNFCY